MFPLDTVRTRMQSLQQPSYSGVWNALSTIARTERLSTLYRGVSAVLVAAIPSHALYFATYEAVKRYMYTNSHSNNNNNSSSGSNNNATLPPSAFVTGCAGIMATAIHDAVATPMDVIKQRMQVHNSSHRSMMSCLRAMIAREGVSALYAAYPTTLFMNIPYTLMHFITYESIKHLLVHGYHDDDHDEHDDHEHEHEHHAWKHLIAGGAAGALGAGVSNPMDVIKTRLQTQGEFGVHYPGGMRQVASEIMSTEGVHGFFRGALPRMLYFAPSAAITWVVYEGVCYFFRDRAQLAQRHAAAAAAAASSTDRRSSSADNSGSSSSSSQEQRQQHTLRHVPASATHTAAAATAATTTTSTLEVPVFYANSSKKE